MGGGGGLFLAVILGIFTRLEFRQVVRGGKALGQKKTESSTIITGLSVFL